LPFAEAPLNVKLGINRCNDLVGNGHLGSSPQAQ
jgi:hypothetical protein